MTASAVHGDPQKPRAVCVVDQKAGKISVLPIGVLPRGLSRLEAASYVGICPATFDKMVRDNLMPGPIRIYGRVVWDVRAVDAAFTALDSGPDGGEDNAIWSKAAV